MLLFVLVFYFVCILSEITYRTSFFYHCSIPEHNSGKETTSEQVPLRNNRNDEKKNKKKKRKNSVKDVLTDAAFVDKHMSALIKRVTMVMAIADDLLGKKMIQDEMYSNIDAAKTNEKKMRKLFQAVRTGGLLIKSAFYTALQTNEPSLVKDLGKNNRYYFHPVITLKHCVYSCAF
uniref:CARD domain-containing protein n=1 Tax=Salmo trutta TaxID=8032 RepID=A0A673VZT2_SALTR